MQGLDRFGNRWQQNGPTNTFVATFTGNNPGNPQNNNRIDGYTHDARVSGFVLTNSELTNANIMNDGLHSYTFDAENRMTKVDGGSTATYSYDVDGHRVEKITATGNYSDPAGTWIFLYDQSGRYVIKMNSNYTFVEGQIYAGSRHLASVGGWMTFSHSDWVGTERFRTYMASVPYTTESCTSLPFGDGLNCTGSDVSNLHFTGKERDAATGLDNFGARYNSSSMGRFVSPDNPKFSEKADPQTWNLYSYVSNNPLARVDLTGDNWFYINGSWQWFNGANVTDTGDPCKQGTKGCNHSNYTHLLKIQKLDEKTDKGATKVKLILYNQNKVIAQGTGFTGGNGDSPVPNGNYQINLNNRGGVDTNASVAMGGGYYVLRAFHDGIQEVGRDVPAGNGTINWQDEWGSLRANLATGPGDGTSYYLHGKGLYFTEGHSYTAGCVCDPYQMVLKAIFALDPSGVGEGDKNGRIAVSVTKPQ